MDDSSFKIIMTAIGSASSVGGLTAMWWFKRWITKVDSRFDNIEKHIQQLVVTDAVSKEQKSNFDGSLSQIQKCLNETTKDVGQLTASIQKVWQVIEGIPKIGVKARISDNIEDN